MLNFLRDAFDIFVESLESMPQYPKVNERNAAIRTLLCDAIVMAAADHRLSRLDFSWLKSRGAT